MASCRPTNNVSVDVSYIFADAGDSQPSVCIGCIGCVYIEGSGCVKVRICIGMGVCKGMDMYRYGGVSNVFVWMCIYSHVYILYRYGYVHDVFVRMCTSCAT